MSVYCCIDCFNEVRCPSLLLIFLSIWFSARCLALLSGLLLSLDGLDHDALVVGLLITNMLILEHIEDIVSRLWIFELLDEVLIASLSLSSLANLLLALKLLLSELFLGFSLFFSSF